MQWVMVSVIFYLLTKYGMSERIGTIYLDSDQEVFVGATFGHSREYSEEVAAAIDREVRDLLRDCYETSMQTLTEHREQLEGLAQLLIERETLSREEFIAFINGEPLPEKEPVRIEEVKKEEEKEEIAEPEQHPED